MQFVDDLKVEGFPSLKFYRADGTVNPFHHKPIFENFVEFLKENGVQGIQK